MHVSKIVKSKYFRGIDFKGQRPLVLTIAAVTEELMGRGSRHDVKCFLWFKESEKGLQLNKSRVAVLEAAYGPESDAWTGGKVRLSFDPTVMFGGQAVGGVKLETPAGVVYTPTAGGLAGWGDVPGAAPGRPPPPVWDGQRQMYVMPAAAPAAPKRPPPPVFNEATGQWDVVNPGTGEIAPPAGQSKTNPQADTWGGTPTLAQRMAAPATATDDGWDAAAAGAGEADFDDSIPF